MIPWIVGVVAVLETTHILWTAKLAAEKALYLDALMYYANGNQDGGELARQTVVKGLRM